MVQLTYASAATIPFTPYGLRDLIDRARLRNQFYDVTGMLLFHSGYFLQVLEGPAGGVHQIYTSITRDRRHRQPKILLYQEIARPEFGSSPLGFADLSLSNQFPAGFSEFYRTMPEITQGPNRAYHVLQSFQQTPRHIEALKVA